MATVATILIAAFSFNAQAVAVDLSPASGDTYSTTSVLLSDLLVDPGIGIIVDNQLFAGFTYSPIGDMPAPDQVSVAGFRDASGNAGIHVAGSFLDLPGGPISDALLRFTVDLDAAALQQGVQLSDAHLFLNGSGVDSNSLFNVDETFAESGEALNVFNTSINAPDQQLSDQAFFSPSLSSLAVTADILASADDEASLPARATSIDFSFSTAIPEPAALGLAVIASIAALARRRRGKRPVNQS